MHTRNRQITGNKDDFHERFAGHVDGFCSGHLAATLGSEDHRLVLRSLSTTAIPLSSLKTPGSE